MIQPDGHAFAGIIAYGQSTVVRARCTRDQAQRSHTMVGGIPDLDYPQHARLNAGRGVLLSSAQGWVPKVRSGGDMGDRDDPQ